MYALFWLLLIGLFGALWCGTLVLVFVGKARQSKLLKNCGKVSFTIITAAGLWCAFWFMQDYINPPSPSSVYKSAFGLEPSSDVADIKATLDGFGDNTQIYLRFRATNNSAHRRHRLKTGITSKSLMAKALEELLFSIVVEASRYRIDRLLYCNTPSWPMRL